MKSQTDATKRNRVATFFAGLGHLWTSIGVALLILLAVEACYRLQGAGRRAIGSLLTRSDAPPHPYAGFDWFPEFVREEDRSSALVWRPYVYFRRRPFDGQYITVDSLGHRLTVQPPRASGDAGTVLFFGGSTMFGSPQRDAFTLPSRFGVRVGALPSGQRDLELINLGETGWVFTQSVLELEMQLRDGLRPRMVVFYDGLNDVVAGVQTGRGGIPQNEQNRALEFALGRELLSWKHDAGAELRAAATLASLGARRLQIVQKLAAGGAASGGQDASVDSIAARVATAYVETARLAEALAGHYGFTALYVWQPNFHTTRKVLTPFEKQMWAELEATPFQMQIRGVHERMPGLIAPRMHALVGDRFVDVSKVFDADTATVYVDIVGHTTEAAVDRVVDAVWPALSRLLAAPRPTPRT